MNNKKVYKKFCDNKNEIPLFCQAWWLDATCKDSWDVSIVESGGTIKAVMPYSIKKKKLGLTYIGQPDLTQHLGPWISPSSAKYSKKIGMEKDLMEELIQQLPPYASFSQNWQYTLSNWLPFYWKGFQQTTGYTYVIEDLSNTDAIFKDMKSNIRSDIRKATSRFNLKVHTDALLDEFLELNQKTFNRQGKKVPYTREYAQRVLLTAQERNQCRWFVAKDEKGLAHAGILIVWDKNSAYYLMGGGDPELRNSGATSLCMWEAIKFASTVTNRFDFEGSMIEPVERFFRAFGGKQKTYFTVTKTPSNLLKMRRFANQLL